MVVQNLKLSMYKLHKRGQQLFFSYFMATKFIHACATAKDHIEELDIQNLVYYII